MADTKISGFPSNPTLSEIQGLAGYDAGGNARISGDDIIAAVKSSMISDGLLCLYDAADYDVATNTWADSSGNSFGTATLENPGPATPTKVTVGTGAPYLECDDTHMLVDKTANPWVQFSYTQEAWVNFTGNSSFSGITDFHPGEEYAMYWGGAGAFFPADEVVMSVDGLDSFPISGGASLPFGVGPTGWYQIVITFTGTTVTIYLNGEPVVTSTGETNVGIGPGSNAELDLLCAQSGGTVYGFEGNCGLIGIYTRALNPSEVKQNFEANRSRFGL